MSDPVSFSCDNPLEYLDPLGLSAIGEACRKCPSLATLKAAKDLIDALSEIASSLVDYPGSGNGHPWEHCVWSCRMASKYGVDYAKKMGDLKEEADMAYRNFAETLNNVCWEKLSDATKKELSAWVCSARQKADYVDNETGRGCSSDCDTCQDCCAKNGVAPGTKEGDTKRYCQGRYKDSMGDPIVESPTAISSFLDY